MVIEQIDGNFCICKLENFSKIKCDENFSFLAKTDEEYSYVCRTNRAPINALKCDNGWKMLRVKGELDFSLIGIISKISSLLADNNIGIFVVSTFNTDYILVKEINYEKAITALKDAGYNIE